MEPTDAATDPSVPQWKTEPIFCICGIVVEIPYNADEALAWAIESRRLFYCSACGHRFHLDTPRAA